MTYLTVSIAYRDIAIFAWGMNVPIWGWCIWQIGKIVRRPKLPQ